MFKHLAWPIHLLKVSENNTLKTIVFCNGTLTDIAAVLYYLLLELGEAAYVRSHSQTSENCLIGIL